MKYEWNGFMSFLVFDIPLLKQLKVLAKGNVNT